MVLPPTSDLYRPDDAPSDDDIQAALEFDPAAAESDTEANEATRAARWKPTSTRSANWAMERYAEKLAAIAAKEAEAAEMLAALDEERRKVEEWLAADTARLRSGARHMEILLTEWALEQRERTGNATIKLPAGEVRTTATTAAVTKVDGKAASEAAVAWARQHGLDVNRKVTETVDLAVVKPLVRIVEYVVLVHDPERGPIGDSESWVQNPALVAQRREEEPDEHGWVKVTWTVTNPVTGEVVNGAIVEEGPFPVDADTGMRLDFLAVRPDSISAKVVLA